MNQIFVVRSVPQNVMCTTKCYVVHSVPHNIQPMLDSMEAEPKWTGPVRSVQLVVVHSLQPHYVCFSWFLVAIYLQILQPIATGMFKRTCVNSII